MPFILGKREPVPGWVGYQNVRSLANGVNPLQHDVYLYFPLWSGLAAVLWRHLYHLWDPTLEKIAEKPAQSHCGYAWVSGQNRFTAINAEEGRVFVHCL